MRAEQVKVYDFRIGDDGHIVGEANIDNTGAGAELLRLARAYMDQHPSVGFSEALNRVRTNRPDLVEQYAQPAGPTVRNHSQRANDDPTGAIHRKALDLIARDVCGGYAEAVAAVLKADPDLSLRYATFVCRRS